MGYASDPEQRPQPRRPERVERLAARQEAAVVLEHAAPPRAQLEVRDARDREAQRGEAALLVEPRRLRPPGSGRTRA